jgi:outer membrane protein TolC
MSAASVEATEAALRAARRHAAEAAAMVRAGALPRADSLAADLRVAQLQTQRIETHRQQRDASDALTLVLGMRVGSLVRAVDPLEPAPLTEPDSDGVRADLEALRQRRQAAVHQADAEDAALLPQLSAFARVTLDGDAPSLADGESWTAGAVLRWELFAGGALRGRAQAARARALRLRHQERELTARIERQRLQSHREVTAAAQRIEAADAAEAVATERLRVTQLTYGAGAARTSDLLAAEADAHTARLLRLKAVHDLRVAKARVEFAHGGRPAPTQDRRRREP